jgi:hypothetical protein
VHAPSLRCAAEKLFHVNTRPLLLAARQVANVLCGNKIGTFTAMKPDLNLIEQEDEDFKLNWAVAKEWNVESRYNVNIDKQRAEDLFNAITDSNSGVMPWLKKFL